MNAPAPGLPAGMNLRMAILEFLLENMENDDHANTGQRIYERLRERYGDVVKRATVFDNCKKMHDERLLEREERNVIGSNNQPLCIVKYFISEKRRVGIVKKIGEIRGGTGQKSMDGA